MDVMMMMMIYSDKCRGGKESIDCKQMEQTEQMKKMKIENINKGNIRSETLLAFYRSPVLPTQIKNFPLFCSLIMI